MSRIGLCMIVKNEAHVIRRCLEKALPLIDFVLIVDTGSTDGTQDTIRAFLAEHQLPGEVIDEPWQDFAANRSSAMRHLRAHPEVDYGLMLDADNYLIFDRNFDAARFKRALNADLYDIKVRTGGTIHHAPLLFSNRKPFFYRGVLHEFLESPPGSATRATAHGFLSEQVQDSARNRNPNKYLDDAKVLEDQLRIETDPFLSTRYTFYLAQSYRDAGDHERALDAYLRRATLGGWAEEIFISLHTAGWLHERLNHSAGEVLQCYLDAYDVCPGRVESLHAATRFCLAQKKYQQAYLFAKHGLGIPFSGNPLFAEPWIYEFGLLDEFSIAAYWTGRYRESFDACTKLLKSPFVPSEYRNRIRQNAHHCITALNQPKLANLLPAV